MYCYTISLRQVTFKAFCVVFPIFYKPHHSGPSKAPPFSWSLLVCSATSPELCRGRVIGADFEWGRTTLQIHLACLRCVILEKELPFCTFLVCFEKYTSLEEKIKEGKRRRGRRKRRAKKKKEGKNRKEKKEKEENKKRRGEFLT